MSLLDLGADAALDAAPRYVEPPKAPPRFSAWSAVPRGIGEAGLQVGASAADTWNAFKAMRDATPEQRRKMDKQGVPIEAFSSETGGALRQVGRSFRPDPQTASVAEQVLYEFARAGSKVIGGAVAGGVPGVLAAGAEEGFSQSDELRTKGVDLKTRSEVGMIQGAGLALAALPAAGQTLRATAGLYLVGGPGGYMAQQALTREVLQQAGRTDLASQYDPFDPVGLAVASILPLPFAAWGVRSTMRAKAAADAEAFRAGPVPSAETQVAAAVREAMPREVVDAAMVGHLVDVRASASDSLQRMVSEPARIESLAEFVVRTGVKGSDAPIVPQFKSDFLSWIKANDGISLRERWDITGEKNAIRANPAGIFRKYGLSSDDLASRAAYAGYMNNDQQFETGLFVELVKRAVNGDPVFTIDQQMQKAAFEQAAQEHSYRVLDLEARARLLGIDPSEAKGNAAALDAYLQANEHRLLGAALDEMAMARKESAGSIYADELDARAGVIARDIEDSARTVPQYEAEVAPLSPVMRALVSKALTKNAAEASKAANPQAATPARGDGTAPAAAASEGGTATGVEAVGVAPRGQIDGEPVALTAGDQAEGAAVNARLALLQAEQPTMKVMVDGMESPLPLAEFLAAAKAEADEMKADAPLMNLAAACAISRGL